MVPYWILVAIGLLFIVTFRESFTDTEFTNVTRPSLDEGSWRSKIDAHAPLGANDRDYIVVLQAFYDKVYSPSPTKPTVKDIEAFLAGSDVVGKPIDTGAVRMILSSAFHIESGITAAAKEEQQVKFKPSKALEPSDGRDEVYIRTENEYRPSDTRIGLLPEGQYAPVPQQLKPRRPGERDYNTTSWTPQLFYDVCVETKTPGCEENVL
jgi:hypothetical protein